MTTETRAVLFDLDGTLADTAPDLAFALNQTLAAFGQPPLPFETIRPVVSHGGMALIRLGFGLEPDAPGFEERRQYLLRIYLDNICRDTRLFPGMEQVLEQLARQRIPWGIVTNKPAWLTEPLLERLPMPVQPSCTVSGDTCPERKPHPMPLLHACKLIGSRPEHSLYVGDAERDMTAGKAAGMTTVCACFGYLLPEDRPETWPADVRIEAPEALLRLPQFAGL
ncbi:MAG TPA: HAD family hydrolase [Chromatiaceae bacterium]|nr:HAD family hydrolase [Chromatiaceae bacterium]